MCFTGRAAKISELLFFKAILSDKFLIENIYVLNIGEGLVIILILPETTEESKNIVASW